MKNLILILNTIILSFNLNAAEVDHSNPESFPPTAFQLAQIVDFISKPSTVTEDIKSIEVNGSYDFEEVHPYSNGSGKYYFHIKDAVKLYKSTKAMFEQDENPWKSYVSHMMSKISVCNTSTYFEYIKDSFDQAGTLELITNAIIFEENFMNQGKTIFWRCSEKSAKAEIEFASEENIQKDLEKYWHLDEVDFGSMHQAIFSQRDSDHNYSFSIGLFSGFFFDGVCNARIGSNPGACTFIYWSSDQYIRKIKSEGFQSYVKRLIHQFPDHFKDDPNPTERLLKTNPDSIADELDKIVVSYPPKEPPFQIFKFFDDTRILASDDYNPKNDYLFGLVLNSDENEKWTKGIHAIFGKGEYFHPKIAYPTEPEIIELWPLKESLNS